MSSLFSIKCVKKTDRLFETDYGTPVLELPFDLIRAPVNRLARSGIRDGSRSSPRNAGSGLHFSRLRGHTMESSFGRILAEKFLRFGVSLFGGAAEPLQHLPSVLRYAYAGAIA